MLDKDYWVQIENRNTWLIDSFEKINPADELRYVDYWSKLKRRFIEGYWAKENNGYRYCSGKMQWYHNMCVIVDVDEFTKGRKLIRPVMRDVDWTMSYGLLIARGFSGFKDDTEYTCYEGITTAFSEEDIPKRHLPYLKKPDGSWKTYVPPKQYLYKLHDKPKGVPLYLNGAKNFFILGTRGGKILPSFIEI